LKPFDLSFRTVSKVILAYMTPHEPSYVAPR